MKLNYNFLFLFWATYNNVCAENCIHPIERFFW